MRTIITVFAKRSMYTLASTLLFIAYMIALQSCGQIGNRQFKSEPSVSEIDISTPNKALTVFVEAFRIGDDKLLDEVLLPGASLPEFNALQKIVCPSPDLVGFDITKFRVVSQRGQYSALSQPGDIEMYVLLEYDESFANPNSKCKIPNHLAVKGVYLLRSVNEKWKIVAAAPFWPEEIQELIHREP